MSQIIDEDANVVPNLSQYLESIGITTSGVDYHIVSIIGAQSSGKSTLLNNVFHTSFQTMNETTGRQQTTKGIHAAYSENSKILIFDIEGSDSRERGDADSLFERKAALFALALSEVVMVNMWQHDIGRYNASSIPLLKTVFEVNLQLFSSESKCHLLFVIRDSTSDSKVIEGQVKRDLESIWNSLTLPPHLAGRPFEDFFIFHFFALPHLKIKKAEFDQAVVKLRDEFEDKEDDNFLFKQPTGKIIPGDGLYNYICQVWDAISQNKELNLPSQRRTLSNFRCDEFVKNSLGEFETAIKEKIEPNVQDKHIIPDFADVCNSIIDQSLQYYDDESRQYVPDIVEDKRKTLLNKMGEMLSQYYQTNCTNFYNKCELDFNSYINEQLPSDLRESEGWEQKAIDELQRCSNTLHDQVQKDIVRNYEWEFDTSNFEPSLQNSLNKKLTELIKSLEDSIIKADLPPYKDSIDKDLNDAFPNMWEELRKKMKSSINKAKEEVKEILSKNTVVERKPSNHIDEKFYRATISRILVASQYVPQKMNLKFDLKFRQDENGKTRDWKPEDDIPLIFEDARQSGLSVLKMFTQCQLREPGEPIPPNDILTQQMINPITAQGLEDKFNDQIEKVYIDAVRIRESKKIRINIPMWMWILFAYFGWSKILFLFRHPIFILFVVAFAALLYFMYKKGYLQIIFNRAKEYSMQGASFVLNFIDEKTGKKLPKGEHKKKKKRTTKQKQDTSNQSNLKKNQTHISLPPTVLSNQEKLAEDISKERNLDINVNKQRSQSVNKFTDSSSTETPSTERPKKAKRVKIPKPPPAAKPTQDTTSEKAMDSIETVKRKHKKSLKKMNTSMTMRPDDFKKMNFP